MTVEINLFHDQSSLKYRTGPGSNSLTPLSAVRHASVVIDCAKRPGINKYVKITREGAQWLSGRVLDSRPKGRGFEPHRRHCVVVLEQDTFILA